MQTQILTCVIVDDEIGNTVVLSKYVSQIPYLNLKKVFQNPIEALAYLLKNPTDLLITDIVMPEISGIRLYECLITEVHTQVIFVSGYADELVESLKYSAVDYLQKPVGQKRFEQATEKFLKLIKTDANKFGEIADEILDKALNNYGKLSKAENTILQLIAEGKTTKEVADIQSISEATVEVHRNNIRKKLELQKSIKLPLIAQYLVENPILQIFVEIYRVTYSIFIGQPILTLTSKLSYL